MHALISQIPTLPPSSGINWSAIIIVAGIWFGFTFGLFMLIRFILLWYWRVNEIVENQEQQIDLLRQILEQSQAKNELKRFTNSD